MEIRETVEHSLGHFAEHLLTGTPTKFLDLSIDTVERATFAVFHGDGDGAGRMVDESAIVTTDMFGCTIAVEIEFADDLFLNVGVWVGSDDLDGQKLKA